MGNFYTNLTIKSGDRAAVLAALQGRSAFVSPVQQGCIVIWDEECEDENDASGLAADLSSDLRAPVLVVTNHDDDVLWLQLWVRGDEVDSYNSCPSYFDDSDITPPEGGDAEALCAAFGGSPERVEEVLRAWSEDDEDGGYVFETERHADLLAALGLPPSAAGSGYRYLEQGEAPRGLEMGELERLR